EPAVAALGCGVSVHAVIRNEEWLTEGPFGMMKIPPFQLGPLVFNTEFRFYFLGLAVVAGTYLAFRRLTRSRFGRALEAIRQSEEAAVTSGINPVLYKSKVFVIAAFTAGLAGALFAHLNRYLNPNDFTLAESINVLIMIVVGGLRSLVGANGAGNTTRVIVLSGVLRPTAGSISFAGEEIAGSPPYRIAQLGIRRTFQTLRIFPELSVLENVAVGYHAHTAAETWDALLGTRRAAREERLTLDRAREALAFVGLHADPGLPAGAPAYGPQRLLELARALLATAL